MEQVPDPSPARARLIRTTAGVSSATRSAAAPRSPSRRASTSSMTAMHRCASSCARCPSPWGDPPIVAAPGEEWVETIS
ncbi:hypothetical protein [Nonomuraea monospora]|uniref:hypothetical protein n=1 Tax=Nonomuraea monospora TaxID=568818 RepID=UPI0031D840CF